MEKQDLVVPYLCVDGIDACFLSSSLDRIASSALCWMWNGCTLSNRCSNPSTMFPSCRKQRVCCLFSTTNNLLPPIACSNSTKTGPPPLRNKRICSRNLLLLQCKVYSVSKYVLAIPCFDANLYVDLSLSIVYCFLCYKLRGI